MRLYTSHASTLIVGLTSFSPSLAINKPPAISSAQVIRDVQEHFNPSALFQPWMAREQASRDAESHNQKKKRRGWKSRQPAQVKMGHGGTLDPMATGVLILGVGSGTKSLSKFLECTKSYDTVLLFGAATDSYDTEGKIVGRTAYEHLTKDKVEQALEKFRGEIMQRPPIFSAIRIDGKRLYEYAREGKEPPREIVDRPVKVEALEVLEWYEGGSHEWKWPATEVEGEERSVAERVMKLGAREGKPRAAQEPVGEQVTKRALEDEGAVEGAHRPASKRTKTEPIKDEPTPATEATPAQNGNRTQDAQPSTTQQASSEEKCPAPAVRLRMTVTSGFYVRSLCHDLAVALDSAGCMAALVRTRQGDFQLGPSNGGEGNVLWYDDLAKGEEVWGPKVQKMLEDWTSKARERQRDEKQTVKKEEVDEEDATIVTEQADGEEVGKDKGKKEKQWNAKPRARHMGREAERARQARRANSSSVEPEPEEMRGITQG
jgi:tRNA pseudouridine55 synthase